MSESAKPPVPAKAKAADENPTIPEDPTFTHADLISRAARSVGHSAPVIAGALCGIKKERLTIEEAQDACENWLSKEHAA